MEIDLEKIIDDVNNKKIHLINGKGSRVTRISKNHTTGPYPYDVHSINGYGVETSGTYNREGKFTDSEFLSTNLIIDKSI